MLDLGESLCVDISGPCQTLWLVGLGLGHHTSFISYFIIVQMICLKKRVWMSNGRHQVGTDIKLVQEVDPTLIGGFKVEYDYTDPANMFNPSKAEDLTLKTLLKKKALNKGVVITNELDGFWGSHFQGRASSSSGSVCPLRTASGPVGHMFFLERCVASMFLEPRTVRLNAMARPSAPPGKKRAEPMNLELLRGTCY